MRARRYGGLSLDKIFNDCDLYGDPAILFDLVEEIRVFQTIIDRSIHVINTIDMTNIHHGCPSKDAVLKIEKILRHGIQLSRNPV